MPKVLIQFFLVILLLVVFNLISALAHSPHDVIFDVALSPNYESDKTVFIIVSNTLKVSTDEGYTWKKLANGLDYASQLTSISISPDFSRDGIVLVTSENDGIYRSQSNGKSWRPANFGLENLNIKSVRFSPSFRDDKSVVACDATGRLFESRDSAHTWQSLKFEFTGRATSACYLPDGENARLLAGTNDGYVMMFDESKNRWEEISIPNGCNEITSMAVSPFFKDDKKVWVGSQNCGVLELDMQDKSSSFVNQGLADGPITSLIATAGSEGEVNLKASTWNQALFNSTSSKLEWLKYDKGLTTDPQAADPYFLMPDFKGIAAHKEVLFLGGFDGLFKSKDGGRTWEQIDTILLSGITSLAVHAEKGSQKHEVALATYGAGAYLYDSKNLSWSINNRGLDWTRLNDISFSPKYTSDGTIFSGSENNFLVFNSQDKIWRRIPVHRSLKTRVAGRLKYFSKKLGISLEWWNRIFKPISGDSRYPTVIASSPNFGENKILFFGTRSSGLYVSSDAGASNSQVWDAVGKLITSICFSPQYSVDETTFTGLYDGSIYKSSNRGKSWHKVDVNNSASGYVHIEISPDFGNDKTILAGNASGLHLSVNGGEKWIPIGRKELGATPKVTCVAISPEFKRDNMMLVGIKGKGLWVTQNRGVTFSPLAKELIDNNYQAKFVKFSPNYNEDGTIYCASSFELFRTTDKGKSWQMLTRPVRYENFREEIKYSGDWQTVRDDRYSALSASYANKVGSRMRLRFNGIGFKWIGDKSPRHGQAKIYLNDSLVEIVSLTSAKEQKSVEIFSKKGIDKRSHELVIEIICAEQNNDCMPISIDAINVIPN